MSENWVLLHSGALGDLCLAIALALRASGVRKRGRLDVISRVNPGRLAECLPAIRRLSSDSVRLHRLYDENASPDAAAISILTGADVLNMLGDSPPLSGALRRIATRVVSVDPTPRDDATEHVVSQWAEQIEAQGVSLEAEGALTPSQQLISAGNGLLGGRVSILIHPGSGGRQKRWPARAFRAVSDGLTAAGLENAFLTGPVEQERWSREEFSEFEGRRLIRCESTDELSAMLAGRRLLISNDAGPAHLAALLGAPTLTLFGPTDPRVWRPIGPRSQVLAGDPAHGANWGLDPMQVVARARSLLD